MKASVSLQWIFKDTWVTTAGNKLLDYMAYGSDGELFLCSEVLFKMEDVM